MAKTTMNIRIDSNIKEEAGKIFSNLGMDMTTAINIFLRQAIQHRGLPFEVKIKEDNVSLENILNDVENNKNMIGPFNSIEELMSDLNA